MAVSVPPRDTIYAPATGLGRAGVAIVRVSGPASAEIVTALAGALPPPRQVSLRGLRHPETGELIDRALVLWLPGPGSFTGEDQAEFHLHGGLAVKRALLAALATCPDSRPAEAGEFTRRAFENGRLDLSAVEGLADLIDAETEWQRRQALRQAEGGLHRHAEAWRESLIAISARLEAGLDFSDEADVAAHLSEGSGDAIVGLRTSLANSLAGAARGERVRDGFVVVIAGAPNAGKSTLLNALAQREAAIVSPIPGTTRDLIEVHCDLDGCPVVFVDTAGLRLHSDTVEQEGMRRARARMASADLVLWLTPPDAPHEAAPPNSLLVTTKIDLRLSERADPEIAISAQNGTGMDDLIERIKALAAEALQGDDDAVLTRERHRLAVAEAVAALDRAGDALYKGADELAAEDVRLAARAIGRISGRVDVEDVLDRIFSQFCIGK